MEKVDVLESFASKENTVEMENSLTETKFGDQFVEEDDEIFEDCKANPYDIGFILGKIPSHVIVDLKPIIDAIPEGAPGTFAGRPVRLYADGIFDLFHYGHAKALEQAKKIFPNSTLIVGCCSDELTHRLKGRTVMIDTERYESLRHCKWVDEVVEDAPWVIDDQFLIKHKIDYVCHDAAPYIDTSGLSEEGDCYGRLKQLGKFIATERTDGISTSDLITRIIQDYDLFVMRQCERGFTFQEMNVPFLKEQEIRFEIAKEKLKKKMVEVQGNTRETVTDLQKNFLSIFDRDNHLRVRFRRNRRLLSEKMQELARNSLC